MDGTVSKQISIGVTASGIVGSFAPYGYIIATVAFGKSINASAGVSASVPLNTIVITTALAQTYFVSASDATGSPPQSLVVVNDASKFVIGQQVDVYELSASGNRDTTQLMNISGKTLTLKPKLSHAHNSGAIVAAPGGAKAIVYAANQRLIDIKASVAISANVTGVALPFQPNITGVIPITIAASGVSTIPTVSGYTFVPPIKITATMRGSMLKTLTGSITSRLDFYPDVVGTTRPPTPGDINGDVIIGITATGTGYTLKGTIASSVVISPNIQVLAPASGTVASPITIGAIVEGSSDTINSLYGVMSFGFAAFAFTDKNTGTINIPLPLSATLRGQAVGGANAAYGFINKPIIIKATAVGKLIPIGRTFAPAKLGIIMGRTGQVAGMDRAVFRAAEGRSFLSAGVPVPTDFFFGSVSGSGPVAKATATVVGTTGTVALTVGGASIMEPVAASLPLSDFCKAIAKAINDYSQTGYDFTARAYGTTVTVLAPGFSGAALNGESLSFIATGNVTLNNLTPPNTVATLEGGQDGNVRILAGISSVSPHTPTVDDPNNQWRNVALLPAPIVAQQFEDGVVTGLMDYPPIVIVPQIMGTISANAGFIDGAVKISASLLDGIYGVTISKLNVNAAVSPTTTGIAVPKIVAHPMLIHTPSSQHVAKAVAYAVIGPDGTAASETYEAMFFF